MHSKNAAQPTSLKEKRLCGEKQLNQKRPYQVLGNLAIFIF